jgi:enoyl-CoA hydratase/carnithine racemase
VNALSHDVCSGLVAAIDECEGAHVRVVVIRANPKSKIWSAGHDIKEIPSGGGRTPCRGPPDWNSLSIASGIAGRLSLQWSIPACGEGPAI